MKQKLLAVFLLSALFLTHFAIGQNAIHFKQKAPHPKWMAKNPFEQKVFIENKGQYEPQGNQVAKNILFGARQGGLQYYFTPTGIWISKMALVKRSEKEIEQIREQKGVKPDEDKDNDGDDGADYKRVEQFHEMSFDGANSQATITANDEVSWHYNYIIKEKMNVVANAWKKIIYHNLYPGIDMEVYFPVDNSSGLKSNAEGGHFEYSFIVHPGADMSQIKIKYNGDIQTNPNGTLTIGSPYGNFTEYTPGAKLLSSGKVVNCRFSYGDSKLKFIADDYDKSETLLIDPLVITPPTFSGSNSVYDIDWDDAGNIYAYGGDHPWQILKYTDKGALLWSFTTNFGGNDLYMGDFAVNRSSESVFITEGVDLGTGGAEVIKLNQAGTQIAEYTGNASFTEMWKIGFSLCSNEAVIAGGGRSAPSYTASYLDTDLVNLKLVNTLNDLSAGYHDMWGLSIDDFGNAYMITAHSHGPQPDSFDNVLLKFPLPNLAPTTWLVSSHYNFLEINSLTYDVPEYNDGGMSSNGYNGMSVSDTTLYTYDSYVLKRWRTSNGKLIDSVSVNGSSKDDSISWGGLATDDCGNIFLGSHDTVKQYNNNLKLVNKYVEPGTVYDVKLSLSDTLYVSGTGFIIDTGITLPPCHIIQATNTIHDVTCDSLGSATISNLHGGTAPYGIVWNTTPASTKDSVGGLKKGTYIATIKDSSCPQQIYADTIKILGPIKLQLSSNNDTLCQGIPVSITAVGGFNYTWSPSAGLSATTGATVIATPTVNTTYTVMGTVSAGGCKDTETAVINIHPLPSIVIKPAQASICIGQSVSLTASGASSYLWNPSTSLSSDTLATVKATPTITTTYTLYGTNTFGCEDSNKVILTVNPIPVVAITPPSTTICDRQSTILSASGATTYQWSPATGLSQTSGSSVTATPTITGTYTIIGTSLGCSDTTTLPIRVVQDSLKVSTNNTAICQGNSVVIISSGANSYNWSPSAGLNQTSGDTVTATPTSTTNYTLIGTGVHGCLDTEKIVITVNPPPVLTIVPSAPQICIYQSIPLSVSLNVGGTSTFTWSPSTGLSQTNGSAVTANPTVTTSYTAYGTDNLGCNDSAKVVVKINPLPVVSVTPVDTICHGLTDTLKAKGGSTYEWSPSTGLNSTTDSTVAASPTITTTYSVYGTDLLGCTDTAMVTVNIIANSIKIALIPANDIICLGNSAIVTASGGINYSWTPSKGLSSTTGDSIIASPTLTSTYTVIGTGFGGCADTTNIPITVSPPPVIAVQPQNPAICDGQAIPLTASGASTYEWSPSAGLYETTGATVDAHPITNTTYKVIGTDSYGCIDSTTITLGVNNAPVGSFTTSVPSICDPLQIQFSNTTTSGISYLWSFGDGDSSTAQNPLHTFSKPGIYKITLISTSANGCTDTITVSDTLFNYNAGVFVPNSFTPSVPGPNQLFKPIVECTQPANYIFRVYDRWGMEMFEATDPSLGWDGTYHGKKEALDTYVYYVKITCGTCSFFNKGNVTLLR